MSKRTDRNQIFDSNGNLISEEIVEVIEYPTPEQSAAVIAKMQATQLLDVPEPDFELAEALAGLYDEWTVGEAVVIGDIRRWDGTLVQCLQAHTTQADWEPNLVPALWRIFRTPDMTEWIAGIAVEVNDEFTYEGILYRCLQAHTTQEGWEPPNTPALWAVV